MLENVYMYILVMAGVTYLIRVLPLTLIRQQIKSPFIQSFLHYVPYATLSAMTFPAILTSTSSMIAATGGFLVAIVLFASIREKLVFAEYPKAFEGFPIALVTAGLMALAFMGFSGLKIW